MHQEVTADIRLMAEAFVENGFREWDRYSHDCGSAISLQKDFDKGWIRIQLAHAIWGFEGSVKDISISGECLYRTEKMSHLYVLSCSGTDSIALALNMETLLLSMIETWKGQWGL